jgi:RNA polymerase sigma-70 factor (ECF subfamily)
MNARVATPPALDFAHLHAPRRRARPAGDPVSAGLPALLPVLRRRARCLTRDAARAEDLVQETSLRALRFRDRFAPDGNLRAWLLCVLSNVFLSERRRAAVELRVLCGAAHDPNGWAAPASVALVPGLPPRLERAIDALPPRLRAVVKLVDLEERSYQDAATALEVPIGTVMSRLHRARRRLALELVPSVQQAGLA